MLFRSPVQPARAARVLHRLPGFLQPAPAYGAGARAARGSHSSHGLSASKMYRTACFAPAAQDRIRSSFASFSLSDRSVRAGGPVPARCFLKRSVGSSAAAYSLCRRNSGAFLSRCGQAGSVTGAYGPAALAPHCGLAPSSKQKNIFPVLLARNARRVTIKI